MASFVCLALVVLVITWLLSTVKPREPSKSWNPLPAVSFLAIVAMAGLALRLVGLLGSLWLDEFGTLWVVEGSWRQVFERSLSFQGQSPLYYLSAWGITRLLGESEAALRLPSLIFGIATALVVYKLGQEAGSRAIGALAAALAWACYPLVQASTNARPYALAGLMSAILLLGFLRATRDGHWTGRALFIAGGVGLFYAQYVCAVQAAGLAGAYALRPELRKQYPLRRFAGDVILQILLVLPCVPQIQDLAGRSGALTWLGAPDYMVLFEVAGGFVLLALAGAFVKNQASPFLEAVTHWLWMATVAPAVFLAALALAGINLLESRYLTVMTIPAAVLAARGVLALRPSHGVIPLGCWLLWNGLYLGAQMSLAGSFGGAGRQDWRGAVSRLNQALSGTPSAPVLFRSGFVEEDERPRGTVSPATFAPLRSPGQPRPTWRVVPLTYRWREVPLREQYFERVVSPAVANARVFFLLSCYNGPADYVERLQDWIEARFPDQFISEPIPAGRGIRLLRFRSRSFVTVATAH